MKHPNLVINTHRNKTLDALVQKLLLDTVGKKFNALVNHSPQFEPFIYVGAEEASLMHAGSGCSWDNDRFHTNAVKIDAATDMGKLVELLTKPAITLSGYTAKFDGSVVKFGCVTVTKSEVEKIIAAFGKTKKNVLITDVTPELDDMLRTILPVFKNRDQAGFYSGNSLRVENGKYASYGCSYDTTCPYDKAYGYTKLSAATQMGEIVNLLKGESKRDLILRDGNAVCFVGESAAVAGVSFDKKFAESVLAAF